MVRVPQAKVSSSIKSDDILDAAKVILEVSLSALWLDSVYFERSYANVSFAAESTAGTDILTSPNIKVDIFWIVLLLRETHLSGT